MSDPSRKRSRSDFVRSLTGSSQHGVSPDVRPTPPGTAASSSFGAAETPVRPGTITDAGAGAILLTNVVYAIDYLKEKKRAMTLDEICNYLSLDAKPETARLRPSLAAALQTDPRVQYNLTPESTEPGREPEPAKTGRSKKLGGTYQFKPKHNIRTGEELVAQLQQQPAAKGFSVKDLKEGWADAATSIDDLERKFQVLAARQRKDNAARMVWLDDPSLKPRQAELDEEFVSLWHSFPIPASGEDLSKRLEEANIKATSAPNQAAERLRKQKLLEEQRAAKKKGRRGQRAGGRVTNDHMSWALRDYSKLRK